MRRRCASHRTESAAASKAEAFANRSLVEPCRTKREEVDAHVRAFKWARFEIQIAKRLTAGCFVSNRCGESSSLSSAAKRGLGSGVGNLHCPALSTNPADRQRRRPCEEEQAFGRGALTSPDFSPREPPYCESRLWQHLTRCAEGLSRLENIQTCMRG